MAMNAGLPHRPLIALRVDDVHDWKVIIVKISVDFLLYGMCHFGRFVDTDMPM